MRIMSNKQYVHTVTVKGSDSEYEFTGTKAEINEKRKMLGGLILTEKIEDPLKVIQMR